VVSSGVIASFGERAGMHLQTINKYVFKLLQEKRECARCGTMFLME
jgi:hypothetical protein